MKLIKKTAYIASTVLGMKCKYVKNITIKHNLKDSMVTHTYVYEYIMSSTSIKEEIRNTISSES